VALPGRSTADRSVTTIAQSTGGGYGPAPHPLVEPGDGQPTMRLRDQHYGVRTLIQHGDDVALRLTWTATVAADHPVQAKSRYGIHCVHTGWPMVD
jgi:hypothetical protein